MAHRRWYVNTLACLTTAAILAACSKDIVAPRERAVPALGRTGIRAHAVAPQPIARLYLEQFVRGRGAPDTFARLISTLRFEAPFTLHVRNGATDRSSRIFGGEVVLDGARLLAQQDFARQSEWAFPVALGSAAQLQVSLTGPPGGFLEIWIEGTRSMPVFCPNGPPGSYETLSEAVEAVWVDGTVLVCDGEHAIDRVVVNKPLALRSQTPAGATLADSHEALPFSYGPAGLIIANVPSGSVRIVDLNFLVRNLAIMTFNIDQVEIDSAHFRGRTRNTTTGIRVVGDFRSPPSARVEVMRSRFDALHLAVWPVNAIETNVRWSTFADMSGGSVVYSGSSAPQPPSASFGVTEHNTFTNCSNVGCVRLVGQAEAGREVVIAHNEMNRDTPDPQQFAVFVSRGAPSGTQPLGLLTIEDNEITGAPPSGDPAAVSSWQVQAFVSAQGGTRGTPVVVRNNRVINVRTGIIARAKVTANDNRLTGGYLAVWQQDPSVFVEFLRNDVVGFTSSLLRNSSGGEAGNFRCNWWGSAVGPLIPAPNVLPSSYTPWATQPIANTTVECDPTPPAPPPPPSLVRVCATPLANGPPTFPTVTLAYDAVTTGGTILICDGAHVVQDVRLAKAITVRNEGPGKPMLDARGARSNFDVRDVIGGAVVLRGLRFSGTWLSTDEAPRQGYGTNVNIGGSYSTITIEESEFFPSGQLVAYDMPAPGQPRLSYNSGIWVWDAAGDSILVRNSAFTGGDIGVGGSGTRVRVETSTFRAHATAAVHRGPSGTTVIEDNDVTDCGTAFCVGVFGTSRVAILRNRIRVDAPRQTYTGIIADDAEVTIADNTITGVGGTRVGTDRMTYPIAFAIGAHAARRVAATNYRITGNVISGAYSGIDLGSMSNIDPYGPVVAVASDNRISDVATPFSGSGGAELVTLRLNRNDFSAYLTVDPEFQGTRFASVDLRCNWWGQTTGPSGYYPPQWRSALEPWAMTPIAGKPEVACP